MVSTLLPRRKWGREGGGTMVVRDGSEWRVVKMMKGGE